MKKNKLSAQHSQELLTELQALGAEATKLISEAAGEQTDHAIALLKGKLEAAQERFTDLYGQAKEKAIAGAKYTDEVVRERPYQSIVLAGGVALIAGVLLGRAQRTDSRRSPGIKNAARLTGQRFITHGVPRIF